MIKVDEDDFRPFVVDGTIGFRTEVLVLDAKAATRARFAVLASTRTDAIGPLGVRVPGPRQFRVLAISRLGRTAWRARGIKEAGLVIAFDPGIRFLSASIASRARDVASTLLHRPDVRESVGDGRQVIVKELRDPSGGGLKLLVGLFLSELPLFLDELLANDLEVVADEPD